jgi:hypothetical protein
MNAFKLWRNCTSVVRERHRPTRTPNLINAASPFPVRHSSMLPRERIILGHNPQRIALVVVPKQLSYTDLVLRTRIKLYRKLTVTRMDEQTGRESVKRALSRPVLQRLPGHTCVFCFVRREGRALVVAPEVGDDGCVGVALDVLSQPVDAVF